MTQPTSTSTIDGGRFWELAALVSYDINGYSAKGDPPLALCISPDSIITYGVYFCVLYLRAYSLKFEVCLILRVIN